MKIALLIGAGLVAGFLADRWLVLRRIDGTAARIFADNGKTHTDVLQGITVARNAVNGEDAAANALAAGL